MSKRKLEKLTIEKPEAKWYRWLHPEFPDHNLSASSTVAGIREDRDTILPGEILPKEWLPSALAWRMCWNSGGLTEVKPEGSELLMLLEKHPAMKKYYGADFLNALKTQIEKEKLEEEAKNG